MLLLRSAGMRLWRAIRWGSSEIETGGRFIHETWTGTAV